MKATWANTVVAESDDTVIIEGNHYFPPQSIKGQYFQPSSTHTTCPWKGIASYYTLKVGDESNADAAWFYLSQKMLPGESETTWLSGAALKSLNES